MHSRAPQQSSPFGVAHPTPSCPQHTCPSDVVPHSRPSQHSDTSVHGAVAARHIGPLELELLSTSIVVLGSGPPVVGPVVVGAAPLLPELELLPELVASPTLPGDA